MSDAVNRFIAGLGQKSGQATTRTVDVPKHVNRREWRALLGQTLELGDTGFVIVLQKDAKKSNRPYQLRDPEGRVMCEGDDLYRIKQLAEQQARMRDEFSQLDASVLDILRKRS